MILADTSVWIDHFRQPLPHLEALITEGTLCNHPFVTGELVVGAIHIRHRLIAALRTLPAIEQVGEAQFYGFIEHHRLNGLGLGFVDLHLLAAAKAAPGVLLWTRDKRLANQADVLGLGYSAG